MSEQRSALVVRGGWDGHDPVTISDLFVPFLEANDFDVTVSDTLDVYTDATLLASTDLIVQCWSFGDATEEQVAGLRHAVERGTGFAGWHGGIVDAFRTSPAYLQLVGGQFAEHPGGIKRFSVQVGHTDLVAGIEDFSVESEQYWVLSDSHNVVHATTAHDGAGEPWGEPVTVPVAWTRKWGAGEVFVSTIGHRLSDFDVPEVRMLTERGLLWVTR